ncbi:hypothetical protein [Mesorhizobium sp. WSM3866]|uniref:hypothetical protein n=1 Tax=Mesorhizobium sp. WSM3866 TaxID=422271 RepID=UPI001140E23C|nr:hypothetical protein [Mesorhizobium sp. WSM3866]
MEEQIAATVDDWQVADLVDNEGRCRIWTIEARVKSATGRQEALANPGVNRDSDSINLFVPSVNAATCTKYAEELNPYRRAAVRSKVQ